MLSYEHIALMPKINEFLAREDFDGLFQSYLNRHKTRLMQR